MSSFGIGAGGIVGSPNPSGGTTILPMFRQAQYSPNPFGSGGYSFGGYGGNSYFNPSINYYLARFTSQYQDSPKFLTWALNAWQPLQDLVNCLQFLSTNFNITNAIGKQLDIVGQLVGVGRILPFQPTGGVSPVLDDSTYRLLLQATIAKNHWDGKLSSIYAIWKSLFPSGRIIINDNQNMTCTILLSGTFSSIIVDLIENGFIVPRPEGVQYTYSLATLPVFGADLNNAYVAGADLGHAI